jgi:hypothetical protein
MMLDPESIALVLKAGDVYVVGGAFIYWAWRSDRRFIAIETTLHMMLQRQQKG